MYKVLFSLYILSLYNNLTSTLVCTICLVNNKKNITQRKIQFIKYLNIYIGASCHSGYKCLSVKFYCVLLCTQQLGLQQKIG